MQSSSIPDVSRGEFLIVRVDGTESRVASRPSIRTVAKQIGAETVDTVLLDRRRQIVMLVDDTGMIDGKPVNTKATDLARAAFGQAYPYSIHGDVAIVHDQDFQ
jgi:hypothetical protein